MMGACSPLSHSLHVDTGVNRVVIVNLQKQGHLTSKGGGPGSSTTFDVLQENISIINCTKYDSSKSVNKYRSSMNTCNILP